MLTYLAVVPQKESSDGHSREGMTQLSQNSGFLNKSIQGDRQGRLAFCSPRPPLCHYLHLSIISFMKNMSHVDMS